MKVRGGSHCGLFIVYGTRSGGCGYCTSWLGVCWGCVSLFGSWEQLSTDVACVHGRQCWSASGVVGVWHASASSGWMPVYLSLGVRQGLRTARRSAAPPPLHRRGHHACHGLRLLGTRAALTDPSPPQLCSRQGRGPFSVKEYVCGLVLLYWVPHRCMPPPGDIVWQYVVLPLLPIYWYLPLSQTLIVLSGLRRGV